MAYALNLISIEVDQPYYRDPFAQYSVMNNVTGRLHDEEFRFKNGEALLAYIDNKVDLTTDEDHLHKHNYGLITALAAVASVTPLAYKDIQVSAYADIHVKAAEKIAHVLGHAYEVDPDDYWDGFEQFKRENFDCINENYNQWARMYNSWNDRHFAYQIPAETAKALDMDFQKTLAYQVCKIYQDNTIVTREEKHARSALAIAAYKEKDLAVQ